MKFFRNLVGLNDEFYNQQMMQEGLFEPILDIVIETMSRDNLLNSSCLEFFDFIRKEHIKTLISHLVENYRERLLKITYVHTFVNFVESYDETQGFASAYDNSFLDTEDDTPKRSENGRGSRWDNGIKDLDAAEEDYFNASDDEDENVGKSPSDRASLHRASPSKPLVDYNSDEDTENMDADVFVSIAMKGDSTSDSSSNSSNGGALTPKSSPSPAPPERLSEKRRREEDEEDELGKLSHHKRRNSSSSAASNTSSILRKKRSFSNGINGSPGNNSKPSKIAISLSPALKSGGDSKGGEGDS